MSALALPPGLMVSVTKALDGLQATFVDSQIVVEADGAGGARVCVEVVSLGEQYVQAESWMGGHLVAQLPYADVYPLFVRGDLTRRDGRPLGIAMSGGHAFLRRPAVQVSRRSRRKDPAIESPAVKFIKVLEWIRRHPGG